MTEREMFFLAAKAAGLHIRDSTRWPDTIVRRVTMDDGSQNWVRWNPRDDDGDSRRLQVACGIDTVHDPDGGRAYVGKQQFTEAGADLCRCVRWAVLRAAASIGRAMPG